ncbi:hypothetical protein SAMN05443574_106135 [Haloarcula vallismortis]|uniref:Uncharacterized protein n=2 Tax=Haloarcula vallismortis TaxID=28442 RepID=M0JI44_HALVA|nr:hypothetical protein [Haloarcula vallismortis]EMA07669.1 hypothetical protein C437_09503 [Haloarcula vallismortis ATCC 29715]SDW74505.1 hypothetical protein SAMN05443574_106135 [Haloarcula vallismortis]
MDAPTFLEVEVERDAVASALDAVPGVAVVEDATSVPSSGLAGPDEAADSGPSLTARLRSLWRQWGLLGTGLSLIALGAATAGLWWYRRRNADDTAVESTNEGTSEWATEGPSETPPPAEPTVDTPSPADTAFEPPAAVAEAEDTPDSEGQETALAGEMPRTESGYRQQDGEGDTEPAGVTGAEAQPPAQGEPEHGETDTDERPGANIDPAPLLGAAFLILSSAVGRWATRDRSEQA